MTSIWLIQRILKCLRNQEKGVLVFRLFSSKKRKTIEKLYSEAPAHKKKRCNNNATLDEDDTYLQNIDLKNLCPVSRSEYEQKPSTSHDSSDAMQRNHSGSSSKVDAIGWELDGHNFQHSDSLQSAIQINFGLKSLRKNQLQAMNATLMGYDTKIIMATGGGKSLCFQLPSALDDRVTLVVCLLKSLIIDQVT